MPTIRRPVVRIASLLAVALFTAQSVIGVSPGAAQVVLKPPTLYVLDPPLAKAVVGGATFTLALLQNGDVWTWGRNDWGQLGQGGHDSFLHFRALRVPGLSGITAISAGDDFAMALRGDGALFTWGRNQKGQLGLGNECQTVFTVYAGSEYPTSVSCPDVAHGTPAQIASSISSIAAGHDYAFAVSYGEVQAWGNNESGQLANYYIPPNSGLTRPNIVPTPKSVFTQSTRLSGVRDVRAINGSLASFIPYGEALLSDGTVWAWPALSLDDWWAAQVRSGETPAHFNSLKPAQTSAGGVTLAAPQVSFDESSMSFATVFVPMILLPGAQPPQLTATWRNPGPGSVLLGPPTILGAGSNNPFTVVSWKLLSSLVQPCPQLLLENEACTATISFMPSVTGNFSGLLYVPNSGDPNHGVRFESVSGSGVARAFP